MKILPIGAKLFHADRYTEGKTHRHDEANNCFSQLSERTYKLV